MTNALDALLSRRGQLLLELAKTGDMRRGSISENHRRCGKPNCRCSDPDHPGHGPYYAFTRKAEGRTKTVNLRPGPQLSKLRMEVDEYQRFRRTCRELVQVNEEICAARPVSEEVSAAEKSGSWKKNGGDRDRARRRSKAGA